MTVTPKQIALISTLLTGESITAAAAAVGVHKTTALRWLKEPSFLETYAASRRALLQDAHNRLLANATAASDTLVELLDSSLPAIRLRAAAVILENLHVHIQASDLESRLAALEKPNDANESDPGAASEA